MSDGKEPVPTMSKETMMEFPYEKISHPPKPTIDSRVADGGGRGTRRSRGESLAGDDDDDEAARQPRRSRGESLAGDDGGGGGGEAMDDAMDEAISPPSETLVRGMVALFSKAINNEFGEQAKEIVQNALKGTEAEELISAVQFLLNEGEGATQRQATDAWATATEGNFTSDDLGRITTSPIFEKDKLNILKKVNSEMPDGGASSDGEAMEEGGGKLELETYDNVCENLLLFLQRRLYYLQNSEKVIKALEEKNEKNEKEEKINPYFIFWNVVNLHPGDQDIDLNLQKDKNLFSDVAGGRRMNPTHTTPSSSQLMGKYYNNIIWQTEQESKKDFKMPPSGDQVGLRFARQFYKRLVGCGIRIPSFFFIDFIPPRIITAATPSFNLPTQLFVESGPNNKYQLGIYLYIFPNNEERHWDAIRDETQNKILFIDEHEWKEEEYWTKNRKPVEPKEPRNKWWIPIDEKGYSLFDYKEELIKETRDLIKQLQDIKISNEEAKKSKQDDVGQALTNDSQQCKNFIRRLCENFTNVSSDNVLLESWVGEDTSFQNEQATKKSPRQYMVWNKILICQMS